MTRVLLLSLALVALANAQIKDVWRESGEIDLEQAASHKSDVDKDDRGCSAQCFVTDDSPSLYHLKPAFNDIFRAAYEVQRLSLMYSVNGTAYLFDSTLSNYHSHSNALKREERGSRIFKFQRDLAIVISGILHHRYDNNPAYLVQFDDEKAWTCDDFSCLDSCNVMQSVNYMSCVETDSSSYRDNKIEPACRLANDVMNDVDTTRLDECSPYLENEMAVAFVNSDFDHNVLRVQHDHGHYHANHYSACQSHFKTRVVIGTHAVDEHEMDDWQSPDAHYVYIRDNAYTMEAASILAGCTHARCCDVKEENFFRDTPYKQYLKGSNIGTKADTCWQMTEDYSVEKATFTLTHSPGIGSNSP